MTTYNVRKLSNNLSDNIRSRNLLTNLNQIVIELLHNSLDANSTNVKVEVNDWFIKVWDDGKGIPFEDFDKIGRRYMSSKLNFIDNDVYGYRGEALSSLLNLSNLKITSKSGSSNDTHTLIVKNQKCVYFGLSVDGNKTENGTIVTVSDIFYNLPVRRRHFNKVKEYQLIKFNIEALALIFPNVSYEFIHDKNTILNIIRTSDTLTTFKDIYGSALITNVEEINYHSHTCQIEGFISLQSVHSRSYQFIFLNKYLVIGGDIHKIINDLFASSSFSQLSTSNHENNFIKRNQSRFPIYVVKINVPLDKVNGIYDPQKKYIYADNEPELINTLKQIVNDFLVKFDFKSPTACVPKASFPTTLSNTLTKKRVVSDTYLKNAKSLTSSQTNKRRNSIDSSKNIDSRRIIEIKDNKSFNQKPEWLEKTLSSFKNPNYKSSKTIKNPFINKTSINVSRKDLSNVQVIGQADSKFIIGKYDNTLIAFDQHAVDERIKVEEYLQELVTNVNVIEVDPSIGIVLTYEEMKKINNNYHILHKWGFQVKVDESIENYNTSKPKYGQIFINTLPVLIADRFINDFGLLKDVVEQAIANSDEYVNVNNEDTQNCPKTLVNLINSKACRNAIKFGDSLSVDDCRILLKKLNKTKLPFQCAHGRPTMQPLLKF